MEEFVLLGSFAFTAILGYCVISKAGIWLEKIENTVRQENFQLHVAVSDLNAVPFVLNEMKRFREQYPNLHSKPYSSDKRLKRYKALESGRQMWRFYRHKRRASLIRGISMQNLTDARPLFCRWRQDGDKMHQ